MPMKREARQLSEFFKFKSVGQIVVGQVDKFGSAGQYDTQFMILSPVCIRVSKDGTPQKFGSVALGLSADLLSKINPRKDLGSYLSIEFTGREPSKKGKPKKVFEVMELTGDEFSKLEKRAMGDYEGNAYRSDRDDDTNGDDEDDLPF